MVAELLIIFAVLFVFDFTALKEVKQHSTLMSHFLKYKMSITPKRQVFLKK